MGKIRSIAGTLTLIPVFLLLAGLATRPAFGQDAYELNWSDSTTYTIDCGTVVPAQWTVKLDSCNYSSPDIYAGASDETIDLTIRINQSGNLTPADRLWISIKENGVEEIAIQAAGDTLSAVFTIDTALLVEAGHYMTIEIAMKTTHSTRFYQIKDGDIYAGYNTPLPVELARFTGDLSNSLATLWWTTSSEINNDYFTVLRSYNGKDYTKAGIVKGVGNSTSNQHYSFTDRPSADQPEVYYRLLQTDFDGLVHMAGKPIRLLHSRLSAIKVYPNPAYGASDLSVHLAGEGNIQRVRIFNKQGKILYDVSPFEETGMLVLHNTSTLLRGLYTVVVTTNNDHDVQRVVKF